jgi:hypothetical protein
MSEVVNNSEQFVYEICKKSFLSLWSYVNPQGRTPQKELCDVLVVCDPHIIVISVKDIQLKDSDNSVVGWKRWQRKAIDDSIKQIKGAVRWLEQSEHVMRRDGSLGLKLPSKDQRIYHNIAVACGGKREVPFTSSEDESGKFYHVMDEQSFLLLLRHLDTISDFVTYLSDKEKFLSKTLAIVSGGEENLLAVYLRNGRQFPSDEDTIVFEDDLWEEISSRPEFNAKLQKDKVSYVWDELIELMCMGGFDTESWLGPDISEAELALRRLALENRFARRLLGDTFINFLNISKTGQVRSRCIHSFSGVGYVFFTYDTDSTYEQRKSELLGRCFAAIHQFTNCFTIVGMGINIPGDSPKHGYSQDLVMLHTENDEWPEEYLRQADYCRDELGFFKNPNVTHLKEDEYPVLE